MCVRHGAKVKVYLCSQGRCTNVAVKGGVCRKHGAKVRSTAAVKVAQIKSSKEEYVGGMGQNALLKTCTLHLELNLTRLQHLSVYLLSAMLLRRHTKEVVVYQQK